MGTLSVWPSMRKRQVRRARIEAMRSSAGMAEGFNAAEPLSKNPNSRKLMTKPSFSR